MDRLRRPLFFLAAALLLGALLIELSSTAVLGRLDPEAATPGLGIEYLALIDLLAMLGVGLIGTAMIVPERVQGRVQGIVTIVGAFLLLLLAVVQLVKAIVKLIIMLTLLSATPFGTAVYLAVYGTFDSDGASATLAVLLLLKLGFAVCLVLAHQRFLQNKGLVLMILTTLLATFVVQFLIAFVPSFLASITDAVGGILAAVLALVWAIVLLIGGIIATIKALRVDRAFA